MSKIREWLSPSTKAGKLLRDAGLMTATVIVGWLIDNWIGVVEAVQELTGDRAPALLLAWCFSLVLLASRWLRERS